MRLLAAGFAASACATAVEVAPAPQADDPACAQAAAHWPATVGPHERAATTAQSPAVAAWGDPAIIARCGVTSPGPTTNDCISVDGIDWVALPLDDGTRFVSYGRAPAIEVLVPRAYDPAPLVLGAFSSAAGTISQGLHRCR